MKRGRKEKNQSVFKMTRGSQEPISNRTRSQGIANTISTSEIIENLKDTYYTNHQPTKSYQNTPNIKPTVKSLLQIILMISPSIMWFNTWNPLHERVNIHERDFEQSNKFESLEKDFMDPSKIEQLRYVLELDAYDQKRGRLIGNIDLDDDL